ncbi:MAG: hypothetical protein GY754_15915 [bacterium]|nr:hypothetical protein [bacterium]
MRKYFNLLVILAVLFMYIGTAHAWKFDTHKDSVIDAFEYMEKQGHGSNEYFAAEFLKYAGGDDIAEELGQKNGETDSFTDTAIGAWWIGYWSHVTLFGMTASVTVYSHFITIFRPGVNGNAYDGYNYRNSLEDGFWGLNGLIKTMMYNMDVKNKGNAGRSVFNPAGGQGIKKAYRFRYQESAANKFYSTTSSRNYKDFQDVVFEPNSNAAAYWYGKALEGRISTTIEREQILYVATAMHMGGDANVVQHVWNTSDHNHFGYESWVNSNYGILYNEETVADLIDEFKEEHNISDDSQLKNITIQEIFVFFAKKAMNTPGPLYSKDYAIKFLAGASGYNGTVALNVLILRKYVYDLYTDESVRKF